MKIFKKVFKISGIVIGIIMVLITALAVYNQIALKAEANKIIPNGQLVDMGNYKLHVYSEGKESDKPVLVFLSGSATVAPVYDFKPLYSLLSSDYRIAVAEKAGYGYSDITDVSRDIDTMVNEVRTALNSAGIESPYVLLPHSMSGLEAIYWAQEYPDEIVGIIGLDMATPYAYEEMDFDKINQTIFWGKVSVISGLHRIPGLYPLSNDLLTDDEKYQQRLLMYKNAVNIDYIKESEAVYENAKIVQDGDVVCCPIIMFSSNGNEVGDFWISSQERYAKEVNAKLEAFDCGHYIHYYKSEEIDQKIKAFLQNI